MSTWRAALALMGCVGFAATLPGSDAGAQVSSTFPQIKINHIDATQAPKIKIYFSLLGSTLRPATLNQVNEVSVYRKPEKATSVELFSIVDEEPVWPKSMSEDDIKAKEDTPPEMIPALDDEGGAAIVAVIPGHQGEEYRQGTLGERSRSGAGLFFKKLGKNNLMNLIWYNDFVWSYVWTRGRTTQLTKLDTQLEACRKWELEELSLEPLEEPPEEPRKNEAECGLTKNYGDFPKLLEPASTPYNGFWPQLFGLRLSGCTPPEHELSVTGVRRSDGDQNNPFLRDDRLIAMDAALEMLVRDARPGQPRVLILVGDGQDGYVNRHDDCRNFHRTKCTSDAKEKGLRGRDRRGFIKTCIEGAMDTIVISEQTDFRRKLESWISLAKSAGIRIYSVAHPSAAEFQQERLAVLAWRTGGTFRVAEDANEVVDHYDDLISELNNQLIVTFVDDDAVADATLSYEVSVRAGGSKFKSKPFSVTVPKVPELGLVAGLQKTGEDKLGKAGFLAVVIGVGLIVLLLLLKILSKIFKGAGGGSKKAAKQAKGGGKKAAKAKAKLKKRAAKKKAAMVKAKLKAKAKKG